METAERFPSGQRFVAELFDSGFLNGRSKTLTGGIVYLYTAQKAFQH